MKKDFAKKHRNAKESTPDFRRSTLFMAGFLLGFFVCFLGALWYFIPITETSSINAGQPIAEPEVKTDEMQLEFYEMFPKSVVPLVEEYNEAGNKVAVDQSSWIVQAGSFLTMSDADKLRGELILLGLEAFITTVEVDEQDYHRVMIGPFDTELARNRVQDKLAQAQIASIIITVPK